MTYTVSGGALNSAQPQPQNHIGSLGPKLFECEYMKNGSVPLNGCFCESIDEHVCMIRDLFAAAIGM